MHLGRTAHMDSGKRFVCIMESLQPLILKSTPSSVETLLAMKSWTERSTNRALELFNITRSHYRSQPDAGPFSGAATRRMYSFVRGRLGVPFFGEDEIKTRDPADHCGHTAPSVGGFIATVYEAIRSGALYEPVIECFRDAAARMTTSE